MNIYDFKAENADGVKTSLKDYAGKVILVINSATECGFTPQYDCLHDLFDKYGDEGFVILDFPCDQFGHQAPGSNEENFLIDRQGNVVERFGPTTDISTVEDKIVSLLRQKHAMEYVYKTKGTCSSEIKLNIDGNVVTNISFTGGCSGNLKAIPLLVDGWTVEEIEKKLSGVVCGHRQTSCADQLAKACRAAYEKQQESRQVCGATGDPAVI